MENSGPVVADIDLEAVSSEEENNEIIATSVSKKARKSSYKFRDQDDIRILQEVLLEKPVGRNSAKKWKAIFDRLLIPVSNYRSIQSRFELLLHAFKGETLKSLRGSGLEEDYDEKVRLLTDIVEQIEDWKLEDTQAKEAVKKKTENDQHRANVIRDAALNTMPDVGLLNITPTSTGETQRKRRKTDEYVEILKSSEENKKEIEVRRLDLLERELLIKEENEKHRRQMEARQIELEERRLALEEKRLAKEHEEKALWFQLLQNKK